MGNQVHHPAVADFIKKTLRVSRVEADMSWQDVCDHLALMGINQTPHDLSSKCSKGQMQAELLLAICVVMGLDSISIDTLRSRLQEAQKRRGA